MLTYTHAGGVIIYRVEGITVGVQLARGLFPARLLHRMRPAHPEVQHLSTLAFSLTW